MGSVCACVYVHVNTQCTNLYCVEYYKSHYRLFSVFCLRIISTVKMRSGGERGSEGGQRERESRKREIEREDRVWWTERERE